MVSKYEEISERLFGKAGLSTRALDDLLDHVLHFIPVTSVKTLDVATEVLLDLPKHVPLFPTRNKGDSHTDTTESACATNTVKISLIVRLFAGARARGERSGDVL